MSEEWINLFYLVAAVLFIVALKDMSHPRTAVRGNMAGSAGMLIAVVVTLTDRRIVSFEVIVAGVVVGALIGALMASRAPLTAMPQVVAVFNGFGGGASALAVGAALEEALKGGFVEEIDVQFTLAASASALIGGVSLTGSAIAFGKLQGLVSEKPVLLPARHVMTATMAVICLALSVWLVVVEDSSTPFWLLVGAAAILGILLVIPIGGADMPVVILAAQRLLGHSRGRPWMGAQQQRVDHRRFAGRGSWLHPDGPHVAGHEPLVSQHHLRRRRRHRSHRRGKR